VGAAVVYGVDFVVVGEEGDNVAVELNGRTAIAFDFF
jgi:hypothetical protein